MTGTVSQWKGLLLAGTEHQQRLILNESLSCSVSGAKYSGQNQKTSICQYAECRNRSQLKNLVLWSVLRFCTHFLTEPTAVSQLVLILHTACLKMWWSNNTARIMRCIIMKNTYTECLSVLWLKYLLFRFCVFFIMLGFSVERTKKRKIRETINH